MSWYHTSIKDGLISIAGKNYDVGSDGELSPEPDEKAVKHLQKHPNYRYQAAPQPKKKAAPAKPVEAKEEPAPAAAPKASSTTKAPAKKKKKAAAKKK